MSKLGILLFFLSSVSVFAADLRLPIFATKLAANDNGVAVEVSTTAVASPEEANAAIGWAQKDLANTLEQNADIKPGIVITQGPDSSGVTIAELEGFAKQIARNANVQKAEISPENAATLKTKFSRWFENHYRISFTIIRLIGNGAAVTWGLAISPDIGWEPALAVGLTAGSMSASLMYYNAHYQRWLVGSGAIVPQWIRYLGLNVAYLGVTKLVGTFAQISPDATVYATLGAIATAALTGTLAQGPWNLFVALKDSVAIERIGLAVAKERGLVIEPSLKPKELRRRLYEIASENAPQETRDIKLSTSVKVLGVSMVATGVTVASLMGVPLANVGLWGLGLTGGTLWLKSVFNERQWNKVKEAYLMSCDAILTQPKLL